MGPPALRRNKGWLSRHQLTQLMARLRAHVHACADQASGTHCNRVHRDFQVLFPFRES